MNVCFIFEDNPDTELSKILLTCYCCIRTPSNVCNLIVQHNKKKTVLSKYFVTVKRYNKKTRYVEPAKSMNLF